MTTTQDLLIPGGDWNLTGFTGSVSLTLDGPAVDLQEIYTSSWTFTNTNSSGSFALPINLDGVDMSLPVQFDSTNIFANGILTYTPTGAPGTIVAVQLDTFTRINTSASIIVSASFQQYSAPAPEPAGFVLLGTGALLLAGIRRLRKRRA